MNTSLTIGIFCAVAASPLAAKSVSGANASDIIVPIGGRMRVAVNDVVGDVVVAPDGPIHPIFSPDFARSAGLSGGVLGVDASVGPQLIRGHTGVARLRLDGSSYRRRVLWFDRAIMPGSDGFFGPAAFPASRITFALRAPTGTERAVIVPLVQDGAFMGTSILVAGKSIFVTWNVQMPYTLATAAAGQAIADAQGGVLRGETTMRAIRFGIERPTRLLALARPITVAGITLDTLVLRSADYGRLSNIPDMMTDAGEIVVTAAQKGAKPRYMLTIGRDGLAHCASISYDLKARKITLLCS